MLIVAFACFLALFVAWLLVPASGRAEVPSPSATGPFAAMEATAD